MGEPNSELECLRHEIEKKPQELVPGSEQLHHVQSSLEDETKKLHEQAEKIKQLEHGLAKERQKAKKFWLEKCKQQLAYKDALEVKDDEIKQLTKQLHSLKTFVKTVNTMPRQ